MVGPSPLILTAERAPPPVSGEQANPSSDPSLHVPITQLQALGSAEDTPNPRIPVQSESRVDEQDEQDGQDSATNTHELAPMPGSVIRTEDDNVGNDILPPELKVVLVLVGLIASGKVRWHSQYVVAYQQSDWLIDHLASDAAVSFRLFLVTLLG